MAALRLSVAPVVRDRQVETISSSTVGIISGFFLESSVSTQVFIKVRVQMLFRFNASMASRWHDS